MVIQCSESAQVIISLSMLILNRGTKISALLLFEKHHQTPYNTMITFCSKLYVQGKKSTQTIGVIKWFCLWVFSVLVTPLNPSTPSVNVHLLQLALCFSSSPAIFSSSSLASSSHWCWVSESTVCSHQHSPASVHGASYPPGARLVSITV